MKECKPAYTDFMATIPRAFYLPSHLRTPAGRYPVWLTARRGRNSRRSPPGGASPLGPESARGPRQGEVRCAASSAHRAAAGHTRTDGAGQTDGPADGARPPHGAGAQPSRTEEDPPPPPPRPRAARRTAGAGRTRRGSRGGEAGGRPAPEGRPRDRWGGGSRSGSALLRLLATPRRRWLGLPE